MMTKYALIKSECLSDVLKIVSKLARTRGERPSISKAPEANR